MARRWQQGIHAIISYLVGYRLAIRGMTVARYVLVPYPLTIGMVVIDPRSWAGYVIGAGEPSILVRVAEEEGLRTVIWANPLLPECRMKSLGCVIRLPRRGSRGVRGGVGGVGSG